MNFWAKLAKPFFVLAPMEGVTDSAFRQIIAGCGRPDVFFTEFTNLEGMFSDGYEAVARRLTYTPVERPLVAQIWGMDENLYEQAGTYLYQLGFDGIDINMGCPDKAVIKSGACSALVRDFDKAACLIQALKRGVAGRVPISVKIRIGFDTVVTEEWVEHILAQGIEALSVHGRTTKQLSKVPADWDEIHRAVKVRDRMGVGTVIIGNGDVISRAQGEQLALQHEVDGIMIGRGVFHNPYIFNKGLNYVDVSVEEKLELLLRHITLYEQLWRSDGVALERPYHILKKYFKIYIQDFPGAFRLRESLMNSKDPDEARRIVGEFESAILGL